ncbi:MAG: RluA family pseudouridine synthase [Coriobacteriales bacterium]|nr:RluA family pseudouridine synthase [Coriobacteriales bacterium]
MKEIVEHKVSAQEQGMRLDALISSLNIENIPSRSSAVKLIEQGRILVNGAASTKKRIVLEDDLLSIEVPYHTTIETSLAANYEIDLDVRFEDDHLLVISKQAGLVCHPCPGHYDDTLVNALVAHCGKENLSEVQGSDRLGIVHRLDADTSGLLIAAKTDIAAAKLQDQLRVRSVDRRYITLVHGTIHDNSAMINAPIGRHPKDRTKMAVCESSNSRSAITSFTTLKTYRGSMKSNGYSLCECKLYTGRTHQIRVHMAYTNHPVVGDPLYGRAANAKLKNKNAAKQLELGLERQFLHSYKIAFEHPITGETLSFQDNLPNDLQKVIDELEKLEE